MKTFSCSLCNEVFAKPEERHSHYLSSHTASMLDRPRLDTVKYPCALCEEVFGTIVKRKTHYLESHVPPLGNNNQEQNKGTKRLFEDGPKEIELTLTFGTDSEESSQVSTSGNYFDKTYYDY